MRETQATQLAVMMYQAWIRPGQEVVDLNSASLQTKERKAVVIPLLNSMHTGQIILLTKVLTAADLRFYGFEAGVPVERCTLVPREGAPLDDTKTSVCVPATFLVKILSRSLLEPFPQGAKD